MRMTTQNGTTAMQSWIESRKESAEDTAAFFARKGVEIGRETIRRWKNGKAVGRKYLATVSRITKISVNALLGA